MGFHPHKVTFHNKEKRKLNEERSEAHVLPRNESLLSLYVRGWVDEEMPVRAMGYYQTVA